MKTPLPPRPRWATSLTWHSSSTAAPTWGSVSLSRLPQRIPEVRPGCQLQLLLRL